MRQPYGLKRQDETYSAEGKHPSQEMSRADSRRALERAERERDTLAAQGMSRADSRRAFKDAIKGEAS